MLVLFYKGAAAVTDPLSGSFIHARRVGKGLGATGGSVGGARGCLSQLQKERGGGEEEGGGAGSVLTLQRDN